MKTTQFFSDDYLAQCKKLSANEIVKYLEDFRLVCAPGRKTRLKLISIKIEADLLEAFKIMVGLDGVPYQSRVKVIMRNWLKNEG